MGDFDAIHIIIWFVTGGLGFIYFRWGKSQQNFTLVITGCLLMGYPYLVSSVSGLIIVGALLGVAPFILNKFVG